MSAYKGSSEIIKTKSKTRNCLMCRRCYTRVDFEEKAHDSVCMDSVCAKAWYLKSHVCADFLEVTGVRSIRNVRKL